VDQGSPPTPPPLDFPLSGFAAGHLPHNPNPVPFHPAGGDKSGMLRFILRCGQGILLPKCKKIPSAVVSSAFAQYPSSLKEEVKFNLPPASSIPFLRPPVRAPLFRVDIPFPALLKVPLSRLDLHYRRLFVSRSWSVTSPAPLPPSPLLFFFWERCFPTPLFFPIHFAMPFSRISFLKKTFFCEQLPTPKGKEFWTVSSSSPHVPLVRPSPYPRRLFQDSYRFPFPTLFFSTTSSTSIFASPRSLFNRAFHLKTRWFFFPAQRKKIRPLFFFLLTPHGRESSHTYFFP